MLAANEYEHISKNPKKIRNADLNVNYVVGDTTPVKNFEKNDLGFYDENGNVYSWTCSYFGTL